jgi:hypothetical protein
MFPNTYSVEEKWKVLTGHKHVVPKLASGSAKVQNEGAQFI